MVRQDSTPIFSAAKPVSYHRSQWFVDVFLFLRLVNQLTLINLLKEVSYLKKITKQKLILAQTLTMKMMFSLLAYFI